LAASLPTMLAMILLKCKLFANKVNIVSKKEMNIGVRVDDQVHAAIEKLAREDERPLAAMARKLIVEALRARKLLDDDPRD